uniref:Uncharacterized protein n=1 Tax=Mus spicilegus TaxID=10103 RepID=A0A8C6MR61_MUSSI
MKFVYGEEQPLKKCLSEGENIQRIPRWILVIVEKAPNQTKPNQTKPNQTKPTKTTGPTHLGSMNTSFSTSVSEMMVSKVWEAAVPEVCKGSLLQREVAPSLPPPPQSGSNAFSLLESL